MLRNEWVSEKNCQNLNECETIEKFWQFYDQMYYCFKDWNFLLKFAARLFFKRHFVKHKG